MGREDLNIQINTNILSHVLPVYLSEQVFR